jgi:perosamine synthetase
MKKLALFGGKPISKKKFTSFNSIGKEEERAVLKVVKEKNLSGFLANAGDSFLGGKYVKKLEELFCKYFKVKYAVSFNSATTALQAAVGALGVSPGDQIITSPVTMSATASAVLMNNAVPVFADIEEDYFCLDAKSIEKNITPKTKAILVVNLYGNSANYNPILKIARKYKLKIIEDNAQSPGALYEGKFTGTVGDIGVFSFNVHKVIQCGEGGMLVTNNKKYAYRAQLIRNHGEAVINDLYMQDKEVFEPIVGSNYRPTEVQAAILIEQFKKMEQLNQQRIKLAEYLTKKIEKLNWLIPPKVPKNSRHVYHRYALRFLPEKIGITKFTFAKAMKKEGFSIVENHGMPLYFFPLYQRKQCYPNTQFPFISKEFSYEVNYNYGICPVAERIHKKELILTEICQHSREIRDIDLFVKAIEKIEENIEELKKYEKKN